MRILAAVALVPLLWGADPAAPGFRLPSNIVPERYRLELTLDPALPDFSGRVEIDLTVSTPSDVIWLNGKDLSVDSATLSAAGHAIAVRAAAFGEEWIRVIPDRPLQPGKFRLGLNFRGKFGDKVPVGAYRKSDGERWYVYTAFTAIDARRAFPCFDQPEFKTPWSVSIRVPAGLTALANSREVARSKEANGMERFQFAETKPLATEVVAFAAGEFDIVEDGTAGRRSVPVRIIAPHGRGREAAGASGSTRMILARLEEYTGIPYMWDKLDHLAVLDMPFGAIENPGLITYRDRGLLAKAQNGTASHRERLRGTMAHELAHQWFGNLVTQRWWDDVWLSESFATFLGEKISDLELPESQRGLAAVQGRLGIMARDQRAIRRDLQSRKEMEAVYSPIVYQKGASFLRMVEVWLGEEPFRGGLQRYLKAHAYSNATASDVAAALQAETGVDVHGVFASYLDQPGFPTLTAKIDCETRKVTVHQDSKLGWSTPVCADAGCTVISGTSGELAVDSCSAWPDVGGAGYFRLTVENGAEYLKKIWGNRSAAEKVAMIADLESLPRAEQLTVLPVILGDREAAVSSAARKLALKLALAPGADLDALRKAVAEPSGRR